jgi:hypothetical protein
VDRWELLRDIGTWGAGIALLFFEASRAQPNEYAMGAALVLIAPRVYKHVKALLPGRTGGPSPSEPPRPRPPESPGPDGTDE